MMKQDEKSTRLAQDFVINKTLVPRIYKRIEDILAHAQSL